MRLSPKYTLTMLLLALPSLAAPPAILNDLSSDAAQVVQSANLLAVHRLDSMTTWTWQAAELTEVKSAVNRMAQTMEKSASAPDAATREAIDRVQPLLKQVSLDTTAAIESLDQTLPIAANTRLREALVKLDADAHLMARTISDSNRIEKLRAASARIQAELAAYNQR